MKDPYQKRWWWSYFHFQDLSFILVMFEDLHKLRKHWRRRLGFGIISNHFYLFYFQDRCKPGYPQYPTILHIFSSKKPYLSETGCSTLVTSNPDEAIELSNWNHHYKSFLKREGRSYSQHHASKRRRKIPSRIEQILTTVQHIDGYNQAFLLKLSPLQLHECAVPSYHLYKYHFWM